MQKIGMLLIAVMVISIGLLSGCTDQQVEQDDERAEITVINEFGDIDVHIRVQAYGKDDDSFDKSQTIVVGYGETEIVWFDTPRTLSNGDFSGYSVAFTAVYRYDQSVSRTKNVGDWFSGGFQSTFTVHGIPPNMEVEERSG